MTTVALCSILGSGVAADASAAASGCGNAVLVDWTDGRIDRTYAPRCYSDALDGLPEDVRAYTTAADDIAQALRARLRAGRADPPPTAPAAAADRPSTAASPLPLPLVSAAAVTLLLALAGVAVVTGRRLRRIRFPHRRARPLGQH